MSQLAIPMQLHAKQKLEFEFPSTLSTTLNEFVKLCLKVNPDERPNCAELLVHEIFNENRQNMDSIGKLILHQCSGHSQSIGAVGGADSGNSGSLRKMNQSKEKCVK